MFFVVYNFTINIYFYFPNSLIKKQKLLSQIQMSIFQVDIKHELNGYQAYIRVCDFCTNCISLMYQNGY